MLDKIGLYEDNYIIIDTETTGLRKTDEVIELGIIDWKGNALYNSLFNPGFNIDSKIMNITGIRNGDLYDAPFFVEKWNEIKRIISGKTIIGYNIQFDIRILKQTIKKYNILVDFDKLYNGVVDAESIVENILSFDSYKQKDVAMALNVYNHQAHRAINDCLTLLDILRKLNTIKSQEIKDAEARMPEIIREKNTAYRKEIKRANKRDAILNLLAQNYTIKEIANELGFIPETIEDNIFRYLDNREMNYNLLLSPETEKIILNAIDEMGGFTGDICSIKRYLNDEVSLIEIKLTVHKNKDLEVVDTNSVESKLSLTMMAKKCNISRDELLDFLVANGFVNDIRTITDKGFKYGIEYMHGDNDAKWPVYGEKIRQLINNNVFKNDYMSTNWNKNRTIKPLSKLNGYRNFKHSASYHYYNVVDRYADLTKKQIIDFVKIFKFEDCKTSAEDFEFIKKAIIAEMKGLITREEKYILFGSKSEAFNVSSKEKNKAELIVNSIAL